MCVHVHKVQDAAVRVRPVLPRSSKEALALPCSLCMHDLQIELPIADIGVDSYRQRVSGRERLIIEGRLQGSAAAAYHELLLGTTIKSVRQHTGLGSA